MKILIDFPLPQELRELILQAAGENPVVFVSNQEERLAAGKDAEVYYGFCSVETFPHLPHLKWIQFSGAGVEIQLFPAMRDSDVLLTNAAGVYASQVADHGFALLLGLTRYLHYSTRYQDKHEWHLAQLSPMMIEIGGMTIGIVGMGGIGRHMAQRARGFETKVIGVDPFLKEKPDLCDELVGMDQLPDVMSRADVTMIACPLTEEM